MPTPTKGPRLGGSATHQRIILANLASQLFEHGSIVTTEAKAKRVRPLAEKLITKAKRGDLHARRTVMKTITDPGVVHVLFTEIAPTMDGREGGYTRITKIGNRQGDNAPMAKIEIVTEKVAPKAKATTTGSADELKAAVAGAEQPAAEQEQVTEADAAQADLDAAATPHEAEGQQAETKADEAKADEAKADEAKADKA